MKRDIEFAELICARYSHDLAGPIGAINNGVEFLEYSEGDIKDKAIDLIKTSAIQAVTRLQFFRQVYGFIKPDSEMSLSDIMVLSDSFFALTKIKLTWEYDQNSEALSQCNARFAKVILNIIYFASTILVSTGAVIVKFDTDRIVKLLVSGDKMIVDDYLLSVLKGEMELVELSTKNIHVYYFMQIIKDLDIKITIEQKDEKFVFVIKK